MEAKILEANPYIPKLVTINRIISENKVNDLKTIELKFNNPGDAKQFNYIPGQFAELSYFGVGECPIGIASSPTDGDMIQFTIKRVGTVTTALHNATEGLIMGVRGPLGNGWRIEDFKGKNVLIIGRDR